MPVTYSSSSLPSPPQQEEVVSTTSYSVDATSARIAAERDFNFFAALCMPAEYRFPFPAFFLTLFHLLSTSTAKIQRYAFGIPRGFAKTTWAKLMLAWYILFTDKSFILVVAASEVKAVNILSDVVDMLGQSNIRALFGHWDQEVEENTKTRKIFYFRGRAIILWAAGVGTSVRGINRKGKRPDVMLMDDIQDREDAKNAELADATYSWMLATLMRARSPFGCTFIYTGNMYPQNSILEKLKNNSHWTSLIAGGILEDGQSLFEDLRPLAELLEEYDADLEAGHPEIFISEVQNCTDLPLASGIDLSKIKQLPTYLVSLPPSAGEAAFIIIDPSAGKKKSDDCTLTYYQVVDGKPIAREIVFGVFSPMQTIDAALSLGFQHDCRAIFVEGVAYQSTLLFWFEFICNQRGISGFFFGELQPKGQNKNNRIKQGYTKLVAGELYLHPAVRSLVLDQYATWIPTRTNNKDDIIDPIGYVEEVMRDYELEIIRPIFHAISHEAGVTASHSDASCPF